VRNPLRLSGPVSPRFDPDEVLAAHGPLVLVLSDAARGPYGAVSAVVVRSRADVAARAGLLVRWSS
jgi:hypothetical protein